MVTRITQVHPAGGFRVRLTFDDGVEREVDLGDVGRGPMFEPLKDPDFFRKVRVDEESRTIVWPNGLDLDPDVLRGTHVPAESEAPVEGAG